MTFQVSCLQVSHPSGCARGQFCIKKDLPLCIQITLTPKIWTCNSNPSTKKEGPPSRSYQHLSLVSIHKLFLPLKIKVRKWIIVGRRRWNFTLFQSNESLFWDNPLLNVQRCWLAVPLGAGSLCQLVCCTIEKKTIML